MSATERTCIRLCFTGDLCIGAGLLDLPEYSNGPVVPEPIQEHLRSHDISVSNMEFAWAPDSMYSRFRGLKMAVPAVRARSVLQSGISVMSLANNHIMDCGPAGLQCAIDAMNDHGIRYVGAGNSLTEAARTLVVTSKGRNIAFIAACDHSRHFADSATPGIAPISENGLVNQVRQAAATADVVIVTLHGDLEFSACPAPWRVRLSRRLIDSGAAAVVQHHPHVMQGYEIYNDGLIAYSLGNFLFRVVGNEYQQHRPGTRDGLMLSLQIDFNGGHRQLSPSFRPIHIDDDNVPRLTADAARADALRSLEELSAILANPPALRSAWRQRSSVEVAALVRGLYYAAARGQFGRGLANLKRALTTPQDRRWMLGWLTRGYR